MNAVVSDAHERLVRRLIVGGAFAFGPAVMLAGLLVLQPSLSPRQASGGVSTTEPVQVPPVPTLTPQQAELRRAIREASALPVQGLTLASRGMVRTDTGAVAPAPEPGVERPANMTLTSIMVAGEQPVAVVMGKLRRPGDEIAAGWKLDSIDASAGLVTLRHTSGQTWVLQLNPDLEK